MAGTFGVIALLCVLANLPFFAERRFLGVFPRKVGKPGGVVVLEVVILFALALVVFRGLEVGGYGTAYEQGWEFYVVAACLFAVAGFPGFVRRYLWKESVSV